MNIRSIITMLCITLMGMLTSTQATAQERTTSGQKVLQGSLRVGSEHDNNVLRTTTAQEQGWLSRYFASLDLTTYLPQRKDSIALSLSQGGKIFTQQSEANTMLTQASLSWRRRLPTTWLFYSKLALDLKDRTENLSLQDYYRGGAMFGLGTQLWQGFILEAKAGARFFAFKPNPAASSRGLAASVLGHQQLPFQLSLSTSYSWLQRRFDIPQQLRVYPEQTTTQEDSPDDLVYIETGPYVRQDLFHSLSTQLNWQGPVLVQASYTLSLNRSNSYGQDLKRHNLGLGLTAMLPLEILCALRVELQRTRYDDPILLDASFLIDEDNRNMATVSLARTIKGDLEVELRSSLYLQEFGGAEDYQRRTIMLALGYHISR